MCLCANSVQGSDEHLAGRLASLVIEGHILAYDDVDELIRQTTRTLLDGMRVRRRP